MRPVLNQSNDTRADKGIKNCMKVILASRFVKEQMGNSSRQIIFDELPEVWRFVPNTHAERNVLPRR